MSRVIIFAVFLILIVEGYTTPILHVTGNKTSIENYPYQASVQYRSSSICGGIILDATTILTHASCLVYRPEDLFVVVGVSDLLNSNDAPEKHTVESYQVHEEFSGDLANDVAIIKLSKPVEYSEKVQPAKLPEQDELPKLNEQVELTGYGKAFIGHELRVAELTVFDNGECQKEYADIDVQIDDLILCAHSDETVRVSEQADAGGPLSLKGTVVGIAFWTRPSMPVISTRVSAYRSWIKQNTGI